MSALVLSSGIWFGYELVTFIIQNRLEYLVRLSIGVGLGIAFQAFVFFLTSLFFPLNRKHAIFLSICFYIVSSFIASRNNKFKPSKRIRYSKLDLIVLISSILFVIYSVHSANIEFGYYTRGPAFADLPFHMNIISSFTNGINYRRKSLFDVWSCFQADILLAYPMFHNFYVAILLNCYDISYSSALQITASILGISFFILLYEVFFVYTKDRVVSSISIISWIFLGGLGYTMIFYPSLYKKRANNWILRFSDRHHTIWMQPYAHILIPQRSALFSAPLCFASIICFMKALSFSKENNDNESGHFMKRKCSIRYFILAGFCTGFLPQLQVHSFVAIAQFAIATCILFFPSKKMFWKLFTNWLIYGLISCIIGLPLTYPFWVRKFENGDSFIRFEPIWNDDIYGKLNFPLITVWWKSLGPFSVVMFFFGWVAVKNLFQIKFWFSAMIVWLLTSFIMYQPWKIDNNKLLFAVWLPIAVPYVTQFYIYVFRNSKIQFFKILVVIFIIQNMLSSMLCFKSEIFKRVVFIDEKDIDCGKWISENTPIQAIFMSYSSRFNPASSLAGRQLYLGFFAWTAQHGVAGPNRELQTSKLLMDTNDSNAFASEAITYVLLKHNTTFNFPIKSGNTAWIKIYQEFPYTIYKLNHTNIALPEHLRVNHAEYVSNKIIDNESVEIEQSDLPSPTKRKRKKIIYNFDSLDF